MSEKDWKYIVSKWHELDARVQELEPQILYIKFRAKRIYDHVIDARSEDANQDYTKMHDHLVAIEENTDAILEAIHGLESKAKNNG